MAQELDSIRGRKLIKKTGDHLQTIIPLITLVVILWRVPDLTLAFVVSWAINMLVTHGTKYAVFRRRPTGGFLSFPSGHTASAVHGAAFMLFHVSVSMAIPLLLAAAFVGASRLITNKHYVSDVLAGAMIGLSTALCVIWIFDLPALFTGRL